MNLDLGAVGDYVEDVVEYVDENFVDPLMDLGNDVVNQGGEIVGDIKEEFDEGIDLFTGCVADLAEATEQYGEALLDTLEKIGESVEEALGSFTESLAEICEKLGELANQAWDAFVEGASGAWSWIEEKVEEAAEWLVRAAEQLYKFVVEEAIPWIISTVEMIPAIIKAFGALLVLPLCILYKEIFGEEEATVIEGIAAHEPRLDEEFKIKRLPDNEKYAVFSDLHMYVDGDLNFFQNNGNAEIYEHALDWYSGRGYHLIEIGDVEDFWMRGGSSKGMILVISEQLPWPYYSALFESSAFQSLNQVHAGNVFVANVDVYTKIRTLFHDIGRYTRVIGNHDDVWADPIMEPIMQIFYPGITVNDYCTLEDQYSHETEVIMAHGHQSDIFNTPLCNFAGKALTNLASIGHDITVGEVDRFSRSKDDWESEWDGNGFPNELQEFAPLEFVSLSEYDLYEDLERIYADSPSQPYLILGHTHHPKDNVRLNGRIVNWDEYSNSGTAGMWEGIVCGLEVQYPNVTVVAWKKEPNGAIVPHELHSISYLGDGYLAST